MKSRMLWIIRVPELSLYPSQPLLRIIQSTLYLFIGMNNRDDVTNETGGDYVIAVRDLYC